MGINVTVQGEYRFSSYCKVNKEELTEKASFSMDISFETFIYLFRRFDFRLTISLQFLKLFENKGS